MKEPEGRFVEEPDTSAPVKMDWRMIVGIAGLIAFGIVLRVVWPSLFYDCHVLAIACSP